ncbi:hypothetical protein GQ457_05G029960 [Hibiscus cannabinus]
MSRLYTEREKRMNNHLLSEEIEEFLGNPTRSIHYSRISHFIYQYMYILVRLKSWMNMIYIYDIPLSHIRKLFPYISKHPLKINRREIGMRCRLTFNLDQAGNSARLTFLASTGLMLFLPSQVERDDRGSICRHQMWEFP